MKNDIYGRITSLNELLNVIDGMIVDVVLLNVLRIYPIILTKMRELINVQLGHCGNQIGSQFIQKIAQQHQINSEGSYTGNDDLTRQGLDIFFNELPNNKFTARSILADFDVSSIDSARASTFGHLYNPDNFVVGMGSAGNYATGYYSKGQEIIYTLMDAIRNQADQCEHLQGFQISHSLSGGTGSGLTSKLMQTLKDEFPSKIIQNFTVFPSYNFDTVVGPLNTLLSLPDLLQNTTMVHVIQNQALLEICKKKTKNQKASFKDLNEIVASAMANSTCGMRFPGQINSSLRKQAVNLVPFPRMHFLMNSLSPLIPQADRLTKYCVREAIVDLMDRPSFLCAYGPPQTRYRRNVSIDNRFLAASVTFRGKISSHEGQIESKQIQQGRTARRYRRWGRRACNTWLKDIVQCSFCDVPPTGQELGDLLTINNTAISYIFRRIDEVITIMKKKFAFRHSYKAEGMQDLQFNEAEADLTELIKDYQQVQDDGEQEEEAYEQE